jgi:hypothetical protein
LEEARVKKVQIEVRSPKAGLCAIALHSTAQERDCLWHCALRNRSNLLADYDWAFDLNNISVVKVRRILIFRQISYN